MRNLLSSARKYTVWSYIVPCVCAGLFVTATTGCASGPRQAETDETRKKKEREPQAPSPDELASSPCGNPEWGSLPDEHAIDGDPSPSDNGNTGGADTSDQNKEDTAGEADKPVDGKQDDDGDD
jgi:hypothetical protein